MIMILGLKLVDSFNAWRNQRVRVWARIQKTRPFKRRVACLTCDTSVANIWEGTSDERRDSGFSCLALLARPLSWVPPPWPSSPLFACTVSTKAVIATRLDQYKHENCTRTELDTRQIIWCGKSITPGRSQKMAQSMDSSCSILNLTIGPIRKQKPELGRRGSTLEPVKDKDWFYCYAHKTKWFDFKI